MESLYSKKRYRDSYYMLLIITPIIYVVLFENFLKAITGFEFLSHVDELLIGIIFLVFGIRVYILNQIRSAILWVVLAFIYFTAISFLGINFNLVNVIFQNIIHIKLFAFFLAFMWLYEYHPSILKISFEAVFWITIAGIVINLILQERFNNLVGFELVYRNDFLRLAGIQVQPNNIGITLGIFYLYFLFKDGIKLTYLKFLVVTILFMVVVFFTGSRTPLLLLPMTFLIFSVQHFGLILRMVTVIFFVVGTFIFVLSLKDTEIYEKTATNISHTVSVDESNYTRGLLLYYSTVIAQTNFPIGAGAASFGTKFSEGSKVYQKYGLTNRHFTEMQGVYESNFASILGEFGVMGIIIYGLLLRMMYVMVVHKDDSIYTKHYYLSLIGALVIFHFTKPVFMNSYPVILFAMAFVLKSVEEKEKRV